ncbi:tail fiber protein [Xanthomonas phage vB_Xar_IVIA-DoCa4]|uniref:Tail fiber protein n=1 Tax=Xanthomonas phage vB_Xar_IVIA-DoCa4 TaxID=2975531 RepID=A0A9X9JMS7_9CAUD|nr:tail fiber protein [Xanthomonas phage vB_Xar_IVIA-DoCa4]
MEFRMIHNKVGVAGLFTISKGKSLDSLEVVADWQNNLITDGGMDVIGGGEYAMAFYNVISDLAVGSGSAEPAFTDTALGAQVARVAAAATMVNGGTTTAPYYAYSRRQFQFAAGTATGVLSELGGMSYNSSNRQYILTTRALIKDSGGNPTTITVLPDEILVVTYEIRMYVDTSSVVTTETIKGVDTTVTCKPIALGRDGSVAGQRAVVWSDYVWGCYYFYGGTGDGTGAITDQYPPGSMYSASNLQIQRVAYIAGTHYRDCICRLSINDTPPGPITAAMGLYNVIPFQVGFSPGVVKTGSETANLRMRISWSRYTP